MLAGGAKTMQPAKRAPNSTAYMVQGACVCYGFVQKVDGKEESGAPRWLLCGGGEEIKVGGAGGECDEETKNIMKRQCDERRSRKF